MNSRNIYIVLLLVFASLKANAQVSPIEKEALQAFYTATNGDNWTTTIEGNGVWDFKTPVTSYNSTTKKGWYGVTVKNGHVVGLAIGNIGLSGELPTEIGNLTYLTNLNLSPAPGISGKIPAEIGNLMALKSLRFSSSQLSGNIPPEITGLSNLVKLTINGSNITGEIPMDIGKLENLEELYLHSNKLNGQIPSSIGDLTKLKVIWVFYNQLSGAIPNEVGNMTNLEVIQFQGNQLSGALPSSIGNLSNLKVIALYTNQITGTIPSSFGNLTNLTQIHLRDNLMSGEIPESLSNLKNLGLVFINRNDFSGPLPFSLISNPTLSRLQIEGNSFVYSDFENNHAEYVSEVDVYTYAPQDKVDEVEAVIIPEGNSFTLTSSELTSSNNTYQWYKDGTVIAGATSKDLVITGATLEDEGSYHFLATNSIVSGLTLERNPITVSIGPAVDPCEKEIVKAEDALTNLLNLLINVVRDGKAGDIPNPYNPEEMQVFSQFLNVENPAIYDFRFFFPQRGSPPRLSFSFGPKSCFQEIELEWDGCKFEQFEIAALVDVAGIQFTEDLKGYQMIYKNISCRRALEKDEHLSEYVELLDCLAICNSCKPITGDIVMETARFCTNVDQQLRLNTPDNVPVSSYSWTVYDTDQTTVLYTSSLPQPTFIFEASGDYPITLVVNYDKGCSEEFNRTFTLVDCDTPCDKSAEIEDIVVSLLGEIIDHVQSGATAADINGTTPTSLEALIPHLAEVNANGVINNFQFLGNDGFSFSFSPDHSDDITFDTSSILLQDLNISGLDLDFTNYLGPNDYTTFVDAILPSHPGSYVKFIQIRHIDFCSDDDPTDCSDEILSAETALENLLNHLIDLVQSGQYDLPSPYNPQEMQQFAPFLNLPEPAIYNFNLINPVGNNPPRISFSFGESSCEQDIELSWNDDCGSITVFDPVRLYNVSGIHFSEALDSYQLVYQSTSCLRTVEPGEYLFPFIEELPCADICDSCSPLTGDILINSSRYCVGSDLEFRFQMIAPFELIESYSWTFFDTDGVTELFASELAQPTYNYSEQGDYPVKLVVNYADGCIAEFNRTTSVMDCIQPCDTSAEVEDLLTSLFIEIVGRVQQGETAADINGSSSTYLTALQPYLTDVDANGLINNFSMVQLGDFSFSFSPSHNDDIEFYAGVDLANLDISGLDLDFLNYDGPEDYTTFSDLYAPSGDFIKLIKVRHVDFCSDGTTDPCELDPWTIQADSCSPGFKTEKSSSSRIETYCAEQCYQFSLSTASQVTSYNWVIYNEDGSELTSITGSDWIQATFPSDGTYNLNLSITYGENNCTEELTKVINVVDCSNTNCTETNENSIVIQDLYLDLINRLIEEYQSTGDISTDNPIELQELAYYITDENPRIYNFQYNNVGTNEYTFSFSDDHDGYDVKVVRSDSQGDLGDTAEDMSNIAFAATSNYATHTIEWGNGVISTGSETRHINFCPDELIDPCEVHVAIVVDESGSIDPDEAAQIRAGLYSYIESEFGSQTQVSITGMSDSDNNLRTDNVGPAYVNTTTKNSLFDPWIAGYGNRNGTPGVSGSSDYWASALKVVNGFDYIPKVVIIFTDGSQTADVQGLKAEISEIRQKSNIYVYGIDNEYYVNGDNSSSKLSRDMDPNFTPKPKSSRNSFDSSNSRNVIPSLRSSLEFLFGVPPVDGETQLLEVDYHGYQDFSQFSTGLTTLYNVLAHSSIGCGIPLEECYDCYSFQPEINKQYWISGWVKEDLNTQVTSYNNSSINVLFQDSSDNVITSEEASFSPSGNIIDGWQRIAGQFTIPPGTVTMSIELNNTSPNIPVYFDDIRVHPINGSMKSFVYDPITYRLMAELDENNYSTYYEYDNEGGLVRVKKETSKGVKTIQETRSGNVIKTNN